MKRRQRPNVIRFESEPVGAAEIDLNITVMRARVVANIFNAIKPFLAELTDIEKLEELLASPLVRAQQQALAHITTNGNGHTNGNGNGNGNGHHAPARRMAKKRTTTTAKSSEYAVMSQKEAIADILTKHPGFTTREITTELERGGYRFQNPDKDHAGSITVTLGTMKRNGLVNAIQNGTWSPNYTLVGGPEAPPVTPTIAAPDTTPVTPGDLTHLSSNDAVVHILAQEPEYTATSRRVADVFMTRFSSTDPLAKTTKRVRQILGRLVESNKATRHHSANGLVFKLKVPRVSVRHHPES